MSEQPAQSLSSVHLDDAEHVDHAETHALERRCDVAVLGGSAAVLAAAL